MILLGVVCWEIIHPVGVRGPPAASFRDSDPRTRGQGPGGEVVLFRDRAAGMPGPEVVGPEVLLPKLGVKTVVEPHLIRLGPICPPVWHARRRGWELQGGRRGLAMLSLAYLLGKRVMLSLAYRLGKRVMLGLACLVGKRGYKRVMMSLAYLVGSRVMMRRQVSPVELGRPGSALELALFVLLAESVMVLFLHPPLGRPGLVRERGHVGRLLGVVVNVRAHRRVARTKSAIAS